MALSLFVLKWTSADKITFLDLSKAFRMIGSSRFDDKPEYLYGAWAGFALFAVHTTVLAETFHDHGSDAKPGAWLAIVGYLVVVIGMIVGARRVAPRPVFGAPAYR